MRGMLNPLHIIWWYRKRFLVAYFDQRTSDSEQIEIWKAPRHTRLRDYIRRWEWDWQLGGRRGFAVEISGKVILVCLV